jgi:hypothetical protein
VRYDLRGWIDGVARAVERHRIGTSRRYVRWTHVGATPIDATRIDTDGARTLGPNPYGCADAANLLYTIGRLPREAAEREAFVKELHAFQNAKTGLFREATHHEIHTTAHCVAALELFDAAPARPLRALDAWEDPERIEPFLEALPWREDPWSASHRGAGLYACLALCGRASADWQDRYFGWLAREWDARTGLLRRGCIGTGALPPLETRFPHLAGTFHYLFCLEHARRPVPHAAALVDTCLEIAARDPFPLGRLVGFAEIDWVYCLTRSLRQSGHRFAAAMDALAAFARRYLAYLNGLDPERDPACDDLHALFGAVSALAELQRALPGAILTDPPLRLVLDRRPFI